MFFRVMFSRLMWTMLLLALAFVGIVSVRNTMRAHPERLPWTPLSLLAPVGPFTGAKLARLADDPPQCRQLLGDAGARFTPLPPIGGAQCGYGDGVILPENRPQTTRFRPAGLKLACPVAAALLVWDREVVRPAALRHFGEPVASIAHLGSFNCRRIAGSSGWSEHATADAIDIAGFTLKSGRRIRVLGDWQGTPAERAFLREVRDGACGVFATVLSPDYNAAHADHFHFDQAARGKTGRQFCR